MRGTCSVAAAWQCDGKSVMGRSPGGLTLVWFVSSAQSGHNRGFTTQCKLCACWAPRLRLIRRAYNSFTTPYTGPIKFAHILYGLFWFYYVKKYMHWLLQQISPTSSLAMDLIKAFYVCTFWYDVVSCFSEHVEHNLQKSW